MISVGVACAMRLQLNTTQNGFFPLPTPPVTERLVLSEVEVSRSNSPLPTYASKYGYATLREQKSKRITIYLKNIS
ncbi:hypothetical protein BDGGKGIB_01250 [Nodularia sphaerocarpa UHCC 0038]|nr:hypothetical protein BDGGKGIB_01250 [Nodularia sphaerocarpa UHCC 0038]